jgi:hypothetical protein
MLDMYLDQLAVSGGEGAVMLRRIKRRLLRQSSTEVNAKINSGF